MKFAVNAQYHARNMTTREEAPYTVYDLFSIGSAYLLYGELHAHTVWLPGSHGIINVPRRASCFPIFPLGSTTDVLRFVDELSGLPLMLRDGNDLVVAINMKEVSGFGKVGKSKDAMLDRGQKLVQLWEDWLRLQRRMPVWFKDLQVNAKAKALLAP